MANTELSPLFRLDADALRCPYPHMNAQRAADPVAFYPEVECHVLTNYDDIVHVSRHPELFSSMMPTGPILARQQMETLGELVAEDPNLGPMLAQMPRGVRVLLSADPPDHGRQRRLVNRAFTPPKAKALEPRIREVANQLVDQFIDRGNVDLVPEFAVLLPLTIIAECLGVEDDELATFKRWSDDFVAAIGNHNMSKVELKRLLMTQFEFGKFFTEKVAQRRDDPRHDLISDIVHAENDGELLPLNEMLSMFSQFLVAGNETTTKLIASSMLILLRDPPLMDKLRNDHTLIPGFVEEALRLETPVQGLYRTATEDTEVGGKPIAKGEHLLLLYAAGNRDAEMFADPECPDPSRTNAMRHLAFGHGEHYCLGAALARAEGRIALETLLSRLTNIALVDGTLEYEESYVLHGLKHLPLTFEPA